MFSYQKRLLYPVYVEHPDRKFADILSEHLRGEENEFTTFFRLIYHRLQIANPYVRDLIGMMAAEELGHIEIISVAVKKLGIEELPQGNVKEGPWVTEHKGGNIELLEMLKIDELKEEKTKRLYLQQLTMTNDPYLKRMIRFLIGREGIHTNMFRKMGSLITEDANNEKFSSLIHEYKMSLRIIK